MTEFFDRTKNLVYQVATYHVGGNYPWGGIVASLGAFPLILLGRMLYIFSIDAFYTCTMFLLVSLLGMLQFILESIPSERRNTITINRLVGMLVGYYYIPFQLKFIVIVTLLYHVIRSLLPHVVLTNWNVDVQAHPGLSGILGLDIAAGIATNICMHILRLFLT